MSDVRLVYTRMGMIMGNLTSFDGQVYHFDMPVIVNMGHNNVGLIPFLAVTEEKSVRIRVEDVDFDGQTFTPAPELLNVYNQQFGSGIVIPETPQTPQLLRG